MRTIEKTFFTFDELSDEAVDESISANEYEFHEDGERA